MIKKRKLNDRLRPWLSITPALLLVGLVVLFPILYTGYISFTNMNVYHWFTYDFVGFANYGDALFVFDSGFLQALLRTILWTIVNMVLQLVIAFVIATLLNSPNLRAKKFYKTLLMFPWAIPGYVSILIWKTGIFNTQFGLLNTWMNQLGLNSVNWLNDNVTAFSFCTILNLWLALPFMIMIIDGALQSIDSSYYEAARVEGANRVRQHLSVTIPLIKPIIGPAVLITIFTTFKQFDIVYLLTMQEGSRTGSDIGTIITYAYENAFITSNYGFSAAVSIIIFALLIILTFATNKSMRNRKGMEND